MARRRVAKNSEARRERSAVATDEQPRPRWVRFAPAQARGGTWRMRAAVGWFCAADERRGAPGVRASVGSFCAHDVRAFSPDPVAATGLELFPPWVRFAQSRVREGVRAALRWVRFA